MHDAIKDAVKEGIIEGLKEALYGYEDSKRKKTWNVDPDLISTREAYRLRGRSRVTQLIRLGLLPQITTGTSPTSIKYVSRKKLTDLDKVNI